jgi:hypothetical protein
MPVANPVDGVFKHVPIQTGEFTLAYTVESEVERAYQHGDSLETRRAVVADWGAFCLKVRI